MTFEEIEHWTTTGHPVNIGTVPDPRGDGEDHLDDYTVACRDGRLVHQHAYVVRGVDPDNGDIFLSNPWYPTGEPVRLTLEEFREAMWRVDVSTLDGWEEV